MAAGELDQYVLLLVQVPDPCQAAMQQYTAQGLAPEAVSMAFIALKGQLQDGSVRTDMPVTASGAPTDLDWHEQQPPEPHC